VRAFTPLSVVLAVMSTVTDHDRPTELGRRDELTALDRAAIRQLDSAFVEAWLRDDTTAVLRQFAPDAILLPPGHTPVVGHSAIRTYWWPNDGSTTRITGFRRTIDEVNGEGSLAYLRGSATLSWRYTKGGQTARQSSRSIDLLILGRDASGRWRITRSMWSQLR